MRIHHTDGRIDRLCQHTHPGPRHKTAGCRRPPPEREALPPVSRVDRIDLPRGEHQHHRVPEPDQVARREYGPFHPSRVPYRENQDRSSLRNGSSVQSMLPLLHGHSSREDHGRPHSQNELPLPDRIPGNLQKGSSCSGYGAEQTAERACRTIGSDQDIPSMTHIAGLVYQPDPDGVRHPLFLQEPPPRTVDSRIKERDAAGPGGTTVPGPTESI